jgi:hypothetical protein
MQRSRIAPAADATWTVDSSRNTIDEAVFVYRSPQRRGLLPDAPETDDSGVNIAQFK